MPVNSDEISVLATALRTDLAHYTPDTVTSCLGENAYAAFKREQSTPALICTQMQAGNPLALHIRALMLRDVLTREDIARAFPTLVKHNLMSTLFTDEGVARFQIIPIATPDHMSTHESMPECVLIASDWGESVGCVPLPEYVMPVGGATRVLMALAGYSPHQRVADIGTGCGIHAIIAALAGAHVVATDVSVRALTYARLNAALAEVEIDFRCGSLLEPLHGERFDVVVSNPPFVITPDTVRQHVKYTYRDGGQKGDALLGELISELHSVMKAGGRAWLLGNWEIANGEQWDEHPKEWTQGLEAWVIEREELSVEQYCEMWLRDGGLTSRDDAYGWNYRLWLEDFTARGVSAIGMGFFILGKPEVGDVQPLRRFEHILGMTPPARELHEYVERVWAHRALITMDDDILAMLRLRTTHAIEQRLYMPGESEPFLIKLSQLDGFGEEIQVTTEGAAVLGACDGELTLGQISDAVCAVLEIRREGEGPLLAGLGELVRTAAGLGMIVL